MWCQSGKPLDINRVANLGLRVSARERFGLRYYVGKVSGFDAMGLPRPEGRGVGSEIASFFRSHHGQCRQTPENQELARAIFCHTTSPEPANDRASEDGTVGVGRGIGPGIGLGRSSDFFQNFVDDRVTQGLREPLAATSLRHGPDSDGVDTVPDSRR